MLRLNLVIAVLLFYSKLWSQDSSAVARHSAKDFGLCFGGSMVALDVASTPYFYSPTQQLISIEDDQRLGLSIGLFYNVALANKWMIRPSIEAHITNMGLTYITGQEYDEHYSVLPVTLEVPIALMYGLNQRGALSTSNGWRKMGVFVAARPIIPITLFNSSFPVTKPFSMNLDLGISLPKSLRKSIFRSEIFVSANVLNWISKGDPDDFRTNMIGDLRRHFAGVRFYFN